MREKRARQHPDTKQWETVEVELSPEEEARFVSDAAREDAKRGADAAAARVAAECATAAAKLDATAARMAEIQANPPQDNPGLKNALRDLAAAVREGVERDKLILRLLQHQNGG